MRNNANDPFTLHILGNIEKSVFLTLNVLQIEAIKQAISASAPFKKHPVDVRMSIPLFFFRFYFVLLAGRDRRSETRNKEDARRKKTGAMSIFFGLYIAACACVPILFMVLYVTKSWLGIDLFPDQHLSDFISFVSQFIEQEEHV